MPPKHWLRSANPKIPAANPMMNTISLVFRNAARSTHTETSTRWTNAWVPAPANSLRSAKLKIPAEVYTNRTSRIAARTHLLRMRKRNATNPVPTNLLRSATMAKTIPAPVNMEMIATIAAMTTPITIRSSSVA